MRIFHLFIVFILSGAITLSFVSCSNISTITPYWATENGTFYTKDLARAQKEIPFPILLPTYLPGNNQKTLLPEIEGPLSKYQDDNSIDVIITYSINLKNSGLGMVMINETSNSSSLGGPETKYGYILQTPEEDTDLERIEINGIFIVKTKDNWSSGYNAYYSFNSNNIFYLIESHYIPNAESYKIVESMVKQIGAPAQ